MSPSAMVETLDGRSLDFSSYRNQGKAEANRMGDEFVFDRDDLAIKAFSVPHTSYVVVLNAEGRVMYTGVGPQQNIDAAVQTGLKR